MTDVTTVQGSRRAVRGHAVMGLGLRLRRLTVPLCLLASAGLAAWYMLHAVTGRVGGLPDAMPFGLGAGAGLAGWLVAGGLAVAGLFFGLRLLAVTVAAVGWMLLPAEHRDVLGRLTDPPPDAGADDGSDSQGSTGGRAKFAVPSGTAEVSRPHLGHLLASRAPAEHLREPGG